MIIDYDKLAEEYVKCYTDKSRVYMIQNYLKTFDGTQGKEVPFKLFPRQQVLCRTLGMEDGSIATTKYRQAGITTVTAGFITCQACLSEKNSPITVLIIGNTLDLAQQMLDKIKNFLLQLPLWMWGEEYYDPTDRSIDITKPPINPNTIWNKCNGKEILLNNGCKIYARSSGPNASRGISACHYLIFDECAFIENGDEVFTAALPTTSSVNGKAIFVSTPNGKDSLYYETCRKAKLKGTSDWNNFNLVEMFWYQDPRYNRFLEWTKRNSNGEVEIVKEPVIKKDGTVEYNEERWEKLLKDGWKPRSPWYVKMCRQFNNDAQKIAQELDVSFLGSANNVVEPEFIEMQEEKNNREPMKKGQDGDPFNIEDTWVWKPPIPGHKYICSCLPEGELVLTKDGYKKIEEVRSDDKLVTLEGKFTEIKHRKYREVKEEKVVSILPYGSVRPMKFTWNHPVYASLKNTRKRLYKDKKYVKWEIFHEFDYVDAEKIKENDWLVIPNVYRLNQLGRDKLDEKWNEYKLVGSEQYSTIENPLFDPDFWWYCGMWLAEGYITKDKNNNLEVNTAHNINEKKYIEKIKLLSERLFKRKTIISESIKDNSTQASIWSKQVAMFLTNNFGKYAGGKYISEWIKYLPDEFKIKLLEGYFDGDGWICKNKEIGAESISLRLLEDLQDICFSLGLITQIKKHRDDNPNAVVCGKKCHTKESYIIAMSKWTSIKYLELIGKENIYFSIPKVRRNNQFSYFSDDLTQYFIKVKKVTEEKYTGKVFNFETVDESHSFYVTRCVSHNCDVSRGDSSDRTAIEIFDVNGVDDDGTPCIEQVLEYHGKRTGDVIGELIYCYASLYGNAFVVVDCVGGVGDATVLTLIHLGYKNLYYDDPNLNKYTMEREASSLKPTKDGKLPGFHSNAVRFQMLTFFANMIRTNQFKIRSKRVINELETWIYKGDAGRIDHMDGKHDDTLTCLAMGLFVMQYHLGDIEKAKERDMAYLRAWVNSSHLKEEVRYNNRTEMSIDPRERKYTMPFYNTKMVNKSTGNPTMDALRWLIM